jgi:carbonic anhydrase/acetyltransferase-like protein (isoleucine patch superfamily)
MNLYDQHPVLGPGIFVAPSASVIGDVLVGESSSIFYGCVLRGDLNRITIGPYTNIQVRLFICHLGEVSLLDPSISSRQRRTDALSPLWLKPPTINRHRPTLVDSVLLVRSLLFSPTLGFFRK